MNEDPSQIGGRSTADGTLLSATGSEAEQYVFDATFATTPAERLFALQMPQTAAGRRRFVAAFAFCLLVHAGAFFALLYKFGLPPATPPVREIPIELVMEPPPPKQPSPPEEPPETPKTLDLKPGLEVPRAANNEKIDREAPDEVSQARQVAPSSGQSTAASPAENVSETAETASAAKGGPSAQTPELANPNAEPIDSAPVKTVTPKQDKPRPQPKAQTDHDAKSMAALLAGIQPLPDYKIGSAARRSPVSGGKGENTYLNVIYGMILSHIPAHVQHIVAPRTDGLIIFDLDGGGNVIDQKIVRSSGLEDVDEAAFAAVRAAGPYPMTPNGFPIRLNFTY